MKSKRIKSSFILVITLLLILSACTSLPQTTEPVATETPSFTPTPTVTPQPTLEAGWTAKTIIDESSALNRQSSQEGIAGLLIEGSQVFVDVDTCWNITFNFENLDPSTGLTGAGILISSSQKNVLTPTFSLGTDGDRWWFSYLPLYNNQPEFVEELAYVTGQEKSFKLCINNAGKAVSLINEKNFVYTHTFPEPIFPYNMKLAAYIDVGPHASINLTTLSSERHEGMDNSAYLAQTVNPVLGFRYFEPQFTLTDPSLEDILSVAYSPNGKTVVSGERSAIFWDSATGSKMQVLDGHNSLIRCMAFSPDGSILATGSWDGTAILWDVETGEQLQTLALHSRSVLSVAFSPDGNIVATGGYDTRIFLWDVATGEKVRTLSAHTLDVNSIAFSPDGSLIASGSTDKTVILWDAVNRVKLKTLSGHTDSVYGVAFSPDGKILVSGAWDGTIIFWDPISGEQIALINTETARVTSVAFSPDGSILLSASQDGTIILWDVASRTKLQTLHGEDMSFGAVFSPDGNSIVNGSKTNIMIWKNNAE